MAHAAATRRGPDEAELATLGQRQLDLQEERYHTLLAAVRNDFLIANDPSGPRNLRKVSFAEYEDAALPSVEAALEPMSTQRAYIDAAHRMFSSNAKTLEGGILYMIAEPQFWAFMRYYHSPAKTTGRPDWDRMFASLLVEPRRSIVPCMRNRYCYVRNACNRLVVTREMTLALREEAKVLGAICDNALCAKKERDGEPGKELMRCSKCQWARFCSPECQKLCWKRHKVVCVPLELLIEEDGLWTMEGGLRGYPTTHEELASGPHGRLP